MTTTWHLTGDTIEIERGRPLCVGIVNVTDDSMFEGARSGTPERAITDGRALIEAGFDMLDVGAVAAGAGEPVPASEEAERLTLAIAGLADAGAPVSADTFSTEVAAGALDAGAAAINDISGSSTDAMLDLVAERGCGLVLTHIEGRPREDRDPRRYEDPVDHLRDWFAERIEAASARGVDPEQVAIDPGLDFDLSVADDLELLRRLDELRELGRPLFVALSRKDFLGAVTAGSWAERVPAGEREWATAAAVALAVDAGADLLRLHDASALQAARVASAIASGAAVG